MIRRRKKTLKMKMRTCAQDELVETARFTDVWNQTAASAFDSSAAEQGAYLITTQTSRPHEPSGAPLSRKLHHHGQAPAMTMLPIRSLARARLPPRALATVPARGFIFTTPLPKQQMPPRPKPPPEDEIEEAYLKGSGPGGQKINKTSSAVQLKHTPTGIVVKCQATRSRTENRSIARKLLAQRLDDLYNGEESRSAIVGDAKKKKAASAAKKSRRKYKKLEEAQKAAAMGPETESQESDGVQKQPEEEQITSKPDQP